ncbi:MAG TPA: glycosyltransferase family 4 protein [Vicinamibacteria bacterium]|nr:glycosyltransferase family 4 protein [Vicinamibacteria bacterium]
MRVLTITSSYPKFQGDTTAPFIEAITRELAARGHRLTVVLPARSDLAPVDIEGVRFRPYRYVPSRALEVFGYAQSLESDRALRGTAMMVTPGAVLSGVYALVSEFRSEPYDVVHAHWVVPSGVMAWLALSIRGTPLVVSLHGSDVFLSEKSRMVRRFAARAFARAASVTACSEDLAQRSLALGAPPPLVIPYGVDTRLFRPRHVSGNDQGVVLAVGRLVPKKGFEYLIDAAALLRGRGVPVRLMLAGRGDLEGELAERATERGIVEQVKFLGNVERADLPALFDSADVVAVPSVRDAAGNVDGLPNVLLEAMASGKAIAATKVAGIPQAVRDGEEALLVPEKDVEALAGALARLLASRELRLKLGSSARERACAHFSWKLAGDRYEDVLRSVTQARCP